MQVNWYKYVLQVLPTRLRTRLFFEFAKTFIWQIPGIEARVMAWFDDARFRASMNASVMSLQKLIERYLGVQAVITELDGKPTDFKVSIQGLVDEARMKALVDGYKLAGKSYLFESAAIGYECEWTGHVCEASRENFIMIHIDNVVGNVATVSVTASEPVKSRISVTFNIDWIKDGVQFPAGFVWSGFYLEANTQYAEKNIEIAPMAGATYVVTYPAIAPETDDYFDYTLVE
jgi:hypothetical protein